MNQNNCLTMIIHFTLCELLSHIARTWFNTLHYEYIKNSTYAKCTTILKEKKHIKKI